MPESEFHADQSAELEKELRSTVQRFRNALALRPNDSEAICRPGGSEFLV